MRSRLLAIFLGAVAILPVPAQGGAFDDCQRLRSIAFDDSKAAFSLYLLLSSGADGLKPNREQADYWLVQASNDHHPPAMKELGLRMLRGIGMEQLPPLAFELLFAAGQAGEDVREPLAEAEAQTSADLVEAIRAAGGKEVTSYTYFNSVSRLSQPACEKAR
ncbi:MAG: sel1 repeat family protein [Alphaproteobacteria bacterium]|nr:sel1 repeat family protein [Alphaproteobacteria bacterium]